MLRDAACAIAVMQIIDAFDATRHPEVVLRRRAPDAIFRDFVDGFTAGFPSDREASAKNNNHAGYLFLLPYFQRVLKLIGSGFTAFGSGYTSFGSGCAAFGAGCTAFGSGCTAFICITHQPDTLYYSILFFLDAI